MRKLINNPMFKLDYSLHEKNIKIYAIIGIIAEIVFYLFVRNNNYMPDSLLLRGLAIVLFLGVLFFPKNNWKTKHKIYYEIVLAVSIPYMFNFMLLYTELSLLWTTSMVFGAVIYGILSNLMISIPVYLTAYPIIRIITHVTGDFDKKVADRSLMVLLVALLTFLIVCIVKIQLERTYSDSKKSMKDAKQINDTYSSLIYISSELSMYDDLDTIYHLLIQRLNYLFPNSSLALLITRGPTKILNQVYHEVTSKEQMFITSHFRSLIDPYALSKVTGTIEMPAEELEFFENWLVFNKDYSMRDINGMSKYDISLFIKNKTITDNEMNAFQIFMEQIKGAIRTRVQAIELERYAMTDPLTKLYNRNSFKEKFQSLVDNMETNGAFSVVFGDVNSLKYVNDTYGHASGDLLLKTCSETVQSVLPSHAKAYRYGGDEIVVLLERTNMEEVENIEKMLNHVFSDKTMVCVNENTDEKQVESVSMCFGATCSDESSVDDMVDIADNRMMCHKKAYYEQEGHVRYR